MEPAPDSAKRVGEMVEFSTKPLYQQVRDELWDRIVKGVWPPGAALPNEFRLAQELNVSIGTVRKAVEELVGEKVVLRQQGRGTFVLDRKSSAFRQDFDRLRAADGSPLAWRYLHMDISVAEASEEERQRLSLKPGDEVYRLRRARETDGRMAVLERCSLPRALFDIDASTPPIETTLVLLCERHGLFPSKAREIVSVEIADETLAEKFDIDPGAPLLKLDRVARDVDCRPLEWRVAWCDMTGKRYVAEHTNIATTRARRPALDWAV